MHFARLALVATAVLVSFACDKNKAIDDPQMTQSGVALGEQSSQMAEMDSEADDSTVQGNVQAVGGTLQGLVGQHQAYSQSSGALARSSGDAFARSTTADEPVYWDGSELCIDIEWSQAGANIDYDVVLDYTTSGSDVTIDGHYNLVYDVGAAGVAYRYVVNATYDQVKSSGGCVVSGSVTVDYEIELDGALGGFGNLSGQDQSGTVIVDYLGCDQVEIRG